MGMKGFSKKVVFTVLTVSFLAAATTIVTAREFPPPSALGIDTEPWFQLTNFGPLLWVSFLILFLSVFWKFANNDPADTYAAACSELQHSPDDQQRNPAGAVDGLGPLSTPELRLIESTTENETGSQQNLLRLEGTEPVTDIIAHSPENLVSYYLNTSTYDHVELPPVELGPLSSSDLQLIESTMGNETDSQQNLLPLEGTEPATNIIAHDQEITRLDQEVADDDGGDDDDDDEQMHSEHTIVMNETGTELEDQDCSQRGGQRTIMGTTEKDFCGITLSDLQQQFGKKMEDAAKCLGVSRSTFKRCCRANGIAKWSRNLKVHPHAATTSNSMLGLATTSSAVPPHAAATSNSITGLATTSSATLTEREAPENMDTLLPQSDNTMSVKVSYKGVKVKFPLALASGKIALEAEVEKRFGIHIGSFSMSYEDDDKDWILITCDADLHYAMHNYKERGLKQMKMKVGPLHKFS